MSVNNKWMSTKRLTTICSYICVWLSRRFCFCKYLCNPYIICFYLPYAILYSCSSDMRTSPLLRQVTCTYHFSRMCWYANVPLLWENQLEINYVIKDQHLGPVSLPRSDTITILFRPSYVDCCLDNSQYDIEKSLLDALVHWVFKQMVQIGMVGPR